MNIWKRFRDFFNAIFFKNIFEPDPMKYLVVGLGNIGAQYVHTRHNIGFDVLDELVKKKEVAFSPNTQGDTALIKHKGRQIHLLKPSTYMNRSGKAVHFWMQKLKIQQGNLLVVVDDINIDLGKIRLRGKGKDGGHNGLKSIDQYAGGNNYARLRVGIGSDFHKGQQVDYVLGEWTDDEKQLKDKIVEKAGEAVLSYCFAGIGNTMNQFNN